MDNGSAVVRAAIPGVAFAVETAYDGFAKEPGYRSHDDDTAVVQRVTPIEELAADDVVKLLVRHETVGSDDLLAWAGTGYAVANAHPEVLASAARTAPPNDEDGLAQVIEDVLAADPPHRVR